MTSHELRVLIFLVFILFLGAALRACRAATSRVDFQVEHVEPRFLAQFDREEALDINRATASELETVPGIGPKLAAEIVLERQKRRGFQTMEELLEIKGFGGKRLEAVRSKLSLKTEKP